MGSFNDNPWSQTQFSKEFRERADIYVLERQRLLGLLSDFMAEFYERGEPIRFADFGAGDGVLSERVLAHTPDSHALLVDGSREMLLAADSRVGKFRNVEYVESGFEDLLDDSGAPNVEKLGALDLAVSSFAIHHLGSQQKVEFFKLIFSILKPGGRLFITDTVLPPSERLEHWYVEQWKRWIRTAQRTMGVEGNLAQDIPNRYKHPVNKPDTLEFQIDTLVDIGFEHVDCYYKNGIFASFGGAKPPA